MIKHTELETEVQYLSSFFLDAYYPPRSSIDPTTKCLGGYEVSQPANRQRRQATWSPEQPEGRWRAFPLEELLARDKVSLDIFWLKDDSLEENAHLPPPQVIAAEILDDLRAALEQFDAIARDLGVEE